MASDRCRPRLLTPDSGVCSSGLNRSNSVNNSVASKEEVGRVRRGPNVVNIKGEESSNEEPSVLRELATMRRRVKDMVEEDTCMICLAIADRGKEEKNPFFLPHKILKNSICKT